MTDDERDTVLLHELQDLLTLTIERVPPADKQAFLTPTPERPWAQAIGMRNIIAHEYGDLDYEIVYNVVAGKPFAELRSQITSILAQRSLS